MTLNFGKYRGYEIEDVPIEYLEWLLDTSKETVQRAEAELKRRQLEDDEDCTMVEKIVKTGFRELTKRFHPDAGGKHEDMVELNAAYAQLTRMLGM